MQTPLERKILLGFLAAAGLLLFSGGAAWFSATNTTDRFAQVDHTYQVLYQTESVLVDDAERAIRELRALRALGVELALDDFGTGFSSLSYLRKLPVQIVKIDREFIAEIASREDAAALTASIVALAKALWLRVVAEGVEKEEERALVAIWGCEEAQGFLFSAPVAPDEAARLWSARGAGSRAERVAG